MLLLLVASAIVVSQGYATAEAINSMYVGNNDNAWEYSHRSGMAVLLEWSEVSGAESYKLKYSANNGRNWSAAGSSDTTSYPWTVPLVNKVRSNCLLKVIALNAKGSKLDAVTSAAFTIEPPLPLELLTVVEGGYDSGENVVLTWSAPVAAETVKIQVTTNGGNSWKSLADAVAADGSQEVTLPQLTKDSSNNYFKLTAKAGDGTKLSVATSSVFTIEGPLALTSPIGSETWEGGTEQVVSWSVDTLPATVDKVIVKYTLNGGSSWNTLTNLTGADAAATSVLWTVPLVDRNKGKSQVKVVLKDAAGKTLALDVSEKFTVTPPQPLTLLTTVDASYDSGENVVLTWSAPVAAETVKIQLTRDGGSSWQTLANAFASDGLQGVALPFVNKAASSCQFKLTAIAANGSKLSAEKSSVFKIKGPLELASPVGGEIWESGSEQVISWSVGSLPTAVDKVLVKYTLNGGDKWKSLVQLTGAEASATSVPWTIPVLGKEKNATQVKIILKDTSGNTLAMDVSEKFTLQPGTWYLDRDGDGYSPSTGDCNDESAAINPGAVEVCDQLDNNCDEGIDEGLSDSCGPNELYTSTTCGGTESDSSQNPDGSATRIFSHLNGDTTYGVVGTRRKADNSIVYMRYLIHEPVGEPKALLVLIAGSYLTAYLDGDASTGEPTNSGANFLVRSAHLFAEQGYRVITINRPTDYADWGGDTIGTPYVFDSYRTSVNHAVDLSRIINEAKQGVNLPVVLVGTSRGTISAVNQNFLADAIALSSPVTTGNGVPVGTGDILPQEITMQTHVMWHRLDRCSVTQPSNSELLLYDFPNVTGDELDGGFYDTVIDDPCNAYDYHSFLGIESCTVGIITSWLDSLTFDVSRPDTLTEFSTQNAPINPGETVDIDLSTVVTPKVPGDLTYSLPYSTTSLGGTVSISGSIVTYTPAEGISGTRDTFVYVVEEDGGGKANNRVVIQL